MGIPANIKVNPVGGARLYQLDVWPSPEGEWPLHPFCIEETIRDNHREYHENYFSYMIVTLMIEGGLIYNYCGEDIEVLEGHILVIPPGNSYSFRSRAERHYRKLVLEVKGSHLQTLSAALRLNRPFLFKPEDFNSFVERFRELGALISTEREEYLHLVLGMTYEIMAKLSLAARKQEPVEKQLLLKAKVRLENPPDMKTSISSLAGKMGVSQSLLDRIFRRELGMSPQAYRMERRAENAKYYLAQSSIPIKEIASRLGYANQLYFSNDFKKRCGVSPKRYRLLNKKGLAATS